MGMTQMVIGAALGCIAAQGGLFTFRRVVSWLQRDDVGVRIRAITPQSGHALVGTFIKYAGPVGASAAVITLGVWAVSDYVAARSAARSAAMASAVDVAPAQVAQAQPMPEPSPAANAPRKADAPAALTANKPDPYADRDYKVQRPAHRAGAPPSLKETLLRRSEDKARAELLKDVQQHLARSQYDCEAADRAGKYLKADLDVWGFASWQARYFPTENYKGAMLAQCKNIKNVLDPGAFDLQSTLAQRP